ncbi:MAG: transglutaminase family protein, partial [Thermomicrobiales bacterium]
MMALLGLVIGPGQQFIEPQTFGVIAGLGYLIGFILAETRIPDLVAHGVGFVTGLTVAMTLVEPELIWDDVRDGAFTSLFQRNWGYVSDLTSAIRSGDRLPDDVAALGISLTLWLVGYAAAWMLFRRLWFFWSVALPAAVLLTSLALDRDQPAWPAFGFTGLAIAQGVVATSRVRDGGWRRRGLRSPRNNQRWAAVGGSILAIVVILAASNAALTIPEETQNWAASQAESLAETVDGQIDRFTGGQSPETLGGNYGEFAEEFRVGEGVPSGDAQIATLRATDRSYLTARNFDYFDGTGWSSTLGEVPDVVGLAPFGETPQISFRADQSMNLPDSVLDSGVEVSGEITLYSPNQDLLLTLARHRSVSIPSSVRVGWQSLDNRYIIDAVQIGDVPLDLRSLIGLLRLASFDEQQLDAGNVRAIDPTLQAAIDEERESLRQYPVETTLGYTPEEGVVLVATGRLPVYTDVEAVFGGDGQVPRTYTSVGVSPVFNADQLASASTTYPTYIAETYLQVPGSVTPRTYELAREIVDTAGAVDPYHRAIAIETYLRTNYQYLLESSLAPDGQDIVDYFLFERRVGRCDHYASSMAIMLRTLGVPTRIVTGLAPVPYDPDAGGFLYRAQDAHSWVEVYFPEFGWIPFEPTPNQDTRDLTSSSTSQQSPVLPTQPTPEPTVEPQQTPESDAEATPVAGAVDVAQPTDGGNLGTLST